MENGWNSTTGKMWTGCIGYYDGSYGHQFTTLGKGSHHLLPDQNELFKSLRKPNFRSYEVVLSLSC